MTEPRRHAIVAVIESRGRFLWIRRGPAAPFSGHWAPPSGSIEPGEEQAAALIRELREELGIDVRPGRKVWECPTHDDRYTLHWWTADLVDGNPTPDGHEVDAVRWLDPTDIALITPAFDADRRFFLEVWPRLDEAQRRPTAPPSSEG